MSGFPTEEQEALYNTWYRKESDLYKKIVSLEADMQSQKRVDFEITIIGLIRLLKGFHELCGGILTERTDQVQMLNGQIQKTYDFLISLFMDLETQWSHMI